MAPDRNASQRHSGAAVVDDRRCSPNSGRASPVDQAAKRAVPGLGQGHSLPGAISISGVSPGAGASFNQTGQPNRSLILPKQANISQLLNRARWQLGASAALAAGGLKLACLFRGFGLRRARLATRQSFHSGRILLFGLIHCGHFVGRAGRGEPSRDSGRRALSDCHGRARARLAPLLSSHARLGNATHVLSLLGRLTLPLSVFCAAAGKLMATNTGTAIMPRRGFIEGLSSVRARVRLTLATGNAQRNDLFCRPIT